MDERSVGAQESRRAELGETLRILRDKAGKSLGQLAEETSYDKSYPYRLEIGGTAVQAGGHGGPGQISRHR